MQRSRSVVALGVLIAFLSIPHAFLGWPELAKELAAIDAADELKGALAAGWYFGSVTMLTLGLLVVWSGRRGGALARRCCLTIGGAYMAFGAGAFILRGFSPHFVGFFGIGLVLVWTTFRAGPELSPV